MYRKPHKRCTRGSRQCIQQKDNSPTLVSAGPSFERGRFIKVVDKQYLSPYFGGSFLGVLYFLIYGVNLPAYATPARVVYQLTDRIVLNASFGAASFLLTHLFFGESRQIGGGNSNSHLTSIRLNA